MKGSPDVSPMAQTPTESLLIYVVACDLFLAHPSPDNRLRYQRVAAMMVLVDQMADIADVSPATRDQIADALIKDASERIIVRGQDGLQESETDCSGCVEMWTILLLQLAYIYDAPFDSNVFMTDAASALDDLQVDLARRPILTAGVTLLERLTQTLGTAYQRAWRTGDDPDDVMTIFNNASAS